jgi:hypothetical protein
MVSRLKLFFLSLSVVALLGFKAEETPLEKILRQLARITAACPQEKVHLHLDKPYYAIGEDIWLKAYLVNSEKNEPSFLSKVLYIDLINNKSEIKKKLTLPVANGLASGNISLLDSLESGTYRIRAYTNYMRNFDGKFFFEKTIEIGNVLDNNIAATQKNKKLDLDLQFFPEGGNLVVGNRTKIGIKAVTSDGLGANLKGYIVNRNKEKVAEFNTEHAGIGAFALMALADENYTAIVISNDGTTKSYPFPKAMDDGYALTINSTEENLNIRIFGSANLINNKDVFLVAQANGLEYASFASKMDKSNLQANIPKKNFPTGIVHFTLFNSESKPVAERLVFVNNKDDLKIEIKPSNGPAGTKKKMELDLITTDAHENLVDGNFSVAVVDESKVPFNEDEEVTILSNLLLTSDLKGFIEHPNYYFNPANSNREKYLDQLLLTQGWKRFVWQDVLSDKEPKITFRPEQGLEISGTIMLGNKPLSNAKINLFSTIPSFFLNLDTLSNAEGNFVFDRLELPDSASFMIQAKSKTNSKDILIKVNQRPSVLPYIPVGNSINILPYLQNTKEMYVELNKFNKLDKGISLKQVTIKAKPKLAPIINVEGSKNINGAVDQIITAKMLEGAINIFSPFYKTPGVMVKLVKNHRMIFRTKAQTSITANPPMLLIVDGVQINQMEVPDFIDGINPADIEGIEVLTSNYNLAILGPDAAGGAIYITTKYGGPSGSIPPATNIAKLTNIGYSPTKEFYSPAYGDPKINSQMQDLRSTIYWNPNLNTNINGQASFSFFNAGTPGKYRVIIEGIDTFGNIGRKVFTYEVSELN